MIAVKALGFPIDDADELFFHLLRAEPCAPNSPTAARHGGQRLAGFHEQLRRKRRPSADMRSLGSDFLFKPGGNQ